MSTSVSQDDAVPAGPVADTDGNAFQIVEIDGDTVTIHNFSFRSRDVASFLRDTTDESRAHAVQRAIEVGVHCLERASAAKDTESVKRQVERIITETEAKVAAIPTAVQSELLKKVGSGDGQVLQPIVQAADRIAADLKDRVREVKQLFGDELDPTKQSSSLGKALKALNELLDPKRTDSVQGSVDGAVAKITGEDGPLARAVKAVVTEAVKPLKDEVNALTKEVRGNEAASEALLATPVKGTEFEEEIVASLQPWAASVGAHVDHVGADNKPGDIVVTLTGAAVAGADCRIVLEAHDRQTPVGRKSIAEGLSRRMAERTATAAVYVSRSAAGLGKEIGDWCEGENDSGPWVATTPAALRTALRLLIVLCRLRLRGSNAAELNGAQIANQIQRIRTALDSVKQIRRNANEVRDSADEINSLADKLRDDVRESLTAIEQALQAATRPAT